MNSMAGGGMEWAMLNLAKFFVDEGASVDLLVASAKGPLLSEVHDQVNLINLKKSYPSPTSWRLWLLKASFKLESRFILLAFAKKIPKAVKAIPSLILYIQKNQPDVILSTPTTANLALMWAKTQCGFKGKAFLREASTLSNVLENKNTLYFRVIKGMIAKWYNRADMVICVSDGVRKDLNDNFSVNINKLQTIYNVMHVKEIELKAQSCEHDQLINKLGEYILAIGRLEPVKDFETLIRSFNLIVKETTFNLVVLGEGSQRHKLEMLIHKLGLTDRIFMPGFIVNPYPFIKKCKFFALSSRWEGCPNVLREALLLEKNVISTDCTGVREIFDGAVTGIVTPVGQHALYAKKLLELIELKDTKSNVDFVQQVQSSKDLYLKLIME